MINKSLTGKPFVHILAMARSGSSVLYEYLIRPEKSEPAFKQPLNLSEPFKDRKILYPDLVEPIVKEIMQNPHQFRVMKNLLPDLLTLNKQQQKMLLDIPSYKVGLLRKDAFEQTCSDCLNDLRIDVWTESVEIPENHFVRLLREVLRDKRNMHNYAHWFDQIIYYEDMWFPPHIVTKQNPPKSQTITNLSRLKEVYNKFMATRNLHKNVQHRGITWKVDQTNNI